MKICEYCRVAPVPEGKDGKFKSIKYCGPRCRNNAAQNRYWVKRLGAK